MSYTALYRKFRPNTFDDVIGQEHIVKTIKNQILSNRVSHAYLFCGTRGTGKTSTAKIFARAINCMSPKQGNPCNQCELCLAALENRSMNVIEIDAASNNGVDNIREIREEVKYPPTEGRYKIYIIDEVHMLSSGAFNALLKTLEEPPAHVVFILATTDPQKVPATILSRCQRFDFHRITTEQITQTLQSYMNTENVLADKEALHYVARLGNGSMRDALSILDQCIAFYSDETLTLNKVLDVVGAVDNSVLFSMTDAILQKNTIKIMELIEQIMIQGRDIAQFVTELVVHFRNILVCNTIEDAFSLLDISSEEYQQLQLQSKKMSKEECMYFIKTFSALQNDLKYASNERILLEVALLKICSITEEKNIDAISAKLKALERKIESGISFTPFPSVKQNTENTTTPKQFKRPPALSEDRKIIKQQWNDICQKIESPSLKSIVKNISPEFKQETDQNIYLVCDYPALKDIVKKNIDFLKQTIEEHIQKSISIVVITKEEYTNWYSSVYGTAEQQTEFDAEFESLVGYYFPEAEIQE